MKLLHTQNAKLQYETVLGLCIKICENIITFCVFPKPHTHTLSKTLLVPRDQCKGHALFAHIEEAYQDVVLWQELEFRHLEPGQG